MAALGGKHQAVTDTLGALELLSSNVVRAAAKKVDSELGSLAVGAVIRLNQISEADRPETAEQLREELFEILRLTRAAEEVRRAYLDLAQEEMGILDDPDYRPAGQ